MAAPYSFAEDASKETIHALLALISELKSAADRRQRDMHGEFLRVDCDDILEHAERSITRIAERLGYQTDILLV